MTTEQMFEEQQRRMAQNREAVTASLMGLPSVQRLLAAVPQLELRSTFELLIRVGHEVGFVVGLDFGRDAIAVVLEQRGLPDAAAVVRGLPSASEVDRG